MALYRDQEVAYRLARKCVECTLPLVSWPQIFSPGVAKCWVAIDYHPLSTLQTHTKDVRKLINPRTLLHSPFTPFTVTFCHIIANPMNAQADLHLLSDYVATLKSLSHFSDGVAKYYRLCDIFQKVADLYVQAKSQEAARMTQQNANTAAQTQGSMQPAINDIDGYLSAIGFAPPVPDNFNGTPAGGNQLDANYLNDWFYGSSSLMGLLEQDLTYPTWPDINYMPNQ